MIQIPASEMALLESKASVLTSTVQAEDELATPEPRDLAGKHALIAVAAARVAGVVRELRNGDDFEAPRPDLIVTRPEAAWLGQRVASATGIDFMSLVQGEDDRVTCDPSLAERYQARRNIVIVASMIGDEEDISEVLKLSQVDGRALAAVALIDERAWPEPDILGTSMHVVFTQPQLTLIA